MFCNVHRLSVYLNIFVVTIVEIHTLILDLCMIFQFSVYRVDLYLKVFQINIKMSIPSLILNEVSVI